MKISNVIFVSICVLFLASSVNARDLGQYNDVDPQVRACFKALKDKNGISCCELNEGVHLDDPDWRADEEGGHSVRLNGEWRKVPPQADIVGTATPCVSYSIVWILNGQIRCFLPGAGI